MKEIDEYIVSVFNKKDIAHIYAIILRADYEFQNIQSKKNLNKFKLEQMENFVIEYDGKYSIFINEQKYDMDVKELKKYVKYIYKYYQKNYPINYNYRLIDPVYFSLFFYDLLDKIEFIKYDVINLADIRLLRYKSRPVKLEESERYKLLKDSNYKMYSPFKSNLVSETPEERVNNILKSVEKNGYGYNQKYAIFYNDEPYIRDGQHRAVAIKYLYGDIDIKILRVYLKDNYFYE